MKLGLRNFCLSILPFGSLCCLVAVVQFESLQQFKLNSNSPAQSYSLSDARLTALKKIPTMGFSNIVANWAFIQFLQYFGDDEARKQTGYDSSSKYLSTAIHHDPYFRNFYVFLSGSSTIFAGNPEETIRVMSEGLDRLYTHRAPDSYYIWRYKGTDELLFLNDSEAAQKSFEMAADWALESNNEEATVVAQVSQQTAQFLAENPDSHLAQINAWGSILSTALDRQTQERAIERIRALGGDVVVTENGQIQIEYSQAGSESRNSDI